MANSKVYLTFDQVLHTSHAVCALHPPESRVRFTIDSLCRDFSTAAPDQICFFEKNHGIHHVQTTKAGFCLVTEENRRFLPDTVVPLITQRPYRSFVQLMRAFCPQEKWRPGVHDNAIVEDKTCVHDTSFVGAGALISKDAKVGPKCWIGPGVIMGAGTDIGEGVVIHARSIIEHTTIGSGSVIHSGACIGKAGFGFVVDDQGFLDIPHIGRVIIGKNVHIGANVVIDRGSFQNTSVGDNTRIDSLVQVGHNVTIGANVMIAAQCGLSGSCVIEDHCILGGQTGIANKVTLRKGTMVAAKSGVMRSSHPGDRLAGIPAMPVRMWHKHSLWIMKQYS